MTDRTRTADPLTVGVTAAADPTVATAPPFDQSVASTASPSAARYVLGEEIARGGMGEVYRATDTVLGREVAVKVLQEKYAPTSSAARRFDDEARITGQLQHPNIPAVHDLGTFPDGRPFLAMKLIRGQTLDALLKARPDPNHDRGKFLAIFEGICHALAYAHAHGVIHRDLKPLNVMVGNFGEVQVMDWGLAKVLAPLSPGGRGAGGEADSEQTAAGTEVRSPRDSDDLPTQAGSILGTPAFMPPEQAIGAIDRIDRRSDVFGLGGILAVILTGLPPFVAPSGETTRQLAASKRLLECFARLDFSEAEPDLIGLAKRCLSPEKEDRPPDADSVATAVAELRTAADDRARRAEIDREKAEVREAEQRTRRRVRAWSAATVGLVLLTGGTAAALLAIRATAAEQATADQLRETEAAQRATAAQLELTRLAEEKAVGEANRANERTALLSTAYGDFVFGIQDKLENHPGTQDLRTELLGIARAGLRRVLDDPSGEGSPDQTLVWSHLRLGDVELDLGQITAAQKAYQTGHDLAKALLASDPTSHRRLADLSACFERLGGLALALSQPEEAVAHLQKSLDLSARAAAATPEDRLGRRNVSVCHGRLGDVLLRVNQPREAREHFEKCHAILTALLADDARNVVFLRDLGLCHTKLGLLALQTVAPREALEHFNASIDVSKRLATVQPKALAPQQDLCYGYHQLGDAFQQLERLQDALGAYQAEWDILRELAADPKAVLSQRSLSVCCNCLGDVYSRLGQPRLARDKYRHGLDISQKLAAANPNHPERQHDLTISYTNVGDASLRLGEIDVAVDSFQKALTTARLLASALPNDVPSHQSVYAACWRLGSVEKARKKYAVAIERFREGRAAVLPFHERKQLVGQFADAVRQAEQQIADCEAKLREQTSHEPAPPPRLVK